jgi:outer membrane PBP1 activator LpoA protein
MTDKHSRLQRKTRVTALILLILTLWGCADKPQKKVVEPVAPPVEKTQPVQEQGVSLALPPSPHSAAFNNAELALAKFDWMQASVTLEEIPTDRLAPDDDTYLSYLQARISYVRGEQATALEALEKLNHPGVNPALRYRVLSFKHYMLEMQGDSLAAAEVADQILRAVPQDTAANWKRSVWRNLESTDKAQLLASLSRATDQQWRGWIELALINREDKIDPSNQLSRWRSDNPTHPAANPLPGGLDYLLKSGTQSGKVALLLPLSGELEPAGKAVLNGFLVAYYAHRAAGGVANELLVIDLDKYPSASSAYDAAVREKASIVVGPLSKDALADLATRLDRPVPILALNRIDQVLPASGSALVQLSLSPEDEAESVAELAFGTGARRALVITPTGEWGSKMETALRERWTALGGTVASSSTYGSYDDYASSIKSAMSLDASEQRAGALRTLLGVNIEFTPRRRQDADVVFLLSRSGPEARSIKPLLSFHYAGNLPVYALSSVYSGAPDERNQDLNGIHLVQIPWLLGASPDLQATLAAGDSGGGSYSELNALGADAFFVQSNFIRLQSGADAMFRANTGLLTMDPNLRIQRKLLAATFDGGALQAR